MTGLPWVKDDGGRAAAGYRGSTDDCVVRAFAIASGLPYGNVYDDLYERARNARRLRMRRSPREGVFPAVYKPYLADLGAVWTPTMQIGSGCRVHMRPGELPAEGRLVVNLSKHLAAVVDGVVRDIEDPCRGGDRCVYGYWTFPQVLRLVRFVEDDVYGLWREYGSVSDSTSPVSRTRNRRIGRLGPQVVRELALTAARGDRVTPAEYDVLSRWRSTARTWFRKTAYRLHAQHEQETNPEVRWLLGYDAHRLLEDVVGDATLLVPSLADDDQVGPCLAAARALVVALEGQSRVTRRARLAGKLANTAGRTPAEAAAFAAKALALRG